MPIRDTAKRVDLPVWRSLLYVPVNVPKYVDKAHTRGADAIQLDLEDSVPNSQKAEARKWSKRSLKWFLRRVQM